MRACAPWPGPERSVSSWDSLGFCVSEPVEVCTSRVLGPCLRCSCCPLLNRNEIACVQPEGVTLADLLKEDKKKRKFCFRQRRAKDHGKWLGRNSVSSRLFPETLTPLPAEGGCVHVRVLHLQVPVCFSCLISWKLARVVFFLSFPKTFVFAKTALQSPFQVNCTF